MITKKKMKAMSDRLDKALAGETKESWEAWIKEVRSREQHHEIPKAKKK